MSTVNIESGMTKNTQPEKKGIRTPDKNYSTKKIKNLILKIN